MIRISVIRNILQLSPYRRWCNIRKVIKTDYVQLITDSMGMGTEGMGIAHLGIPWELEWVKNLGMGMGWEGMGTE